MLNKKSKKIFPLSLVKNENDLNLLISLNKDLNLEETIIFNQLMEIMTKEDEEC